MSLSPEAGWALDCSHCWTGLTTTAAQLSAISPLRAQHLESSRRMERLRVYELSAEKQPEVPRQSSSFVRGVELALRLCFPRWTPHTRKESVSFLGCQYTPSLILRCQQWESKPVLKYVLFLISFQNLFKVHSLEKGKE